MKAEVAVVGGGAAGLMAALTAAEQGAQVLLIEKNERCGVKLRITGKGRCNVCNDCEPAQVMAAVPRGGKFLFSALRGFSPADCMAFFEGLGVPLKTERGRRVFPQSDKAADVAEALIARCRELGVVFLRARVTRVLCRDGAVAGLDTTAGRVDCERVILATGGMSYPKTGSNGEGYALAGALGHTVTPPVASLVGLESPDAFCAQMQGLSLRNVRLTLLGPGQKKLWSEQGEMQFTHFGVSGPLVLSASAHMGREAEGFNLSIDLKPALDEKTLDERILRDFSEAKNKDFVNALGGLAPRLLIPVLVERSGIDGREKVNAVTKEQRRRLVELMKDFTVRVSGKRPIEEAIVTSGGVVTKEVNPSTMESRLVRGLYFAGEILDLDAYTGGFNLQIAWSTGRAAGLSAAERL